MKNKGRNRNYIKNKEAKCGEELNCPVCNSTFTKKQWQQAFCCGKCKDKFWNSKGDRHSDPNYQTKYNMKHPERYKGLIGLGVTRDEREHYEALYALATDNEFRQHVRDNHNNSSGDWDAHDAPNTLAQEYKNYKQDLEAY